MQRKKSSILAATAVSVLLYSTVFFEHEFDVGSLHMPLFLLLHVLLEFTSIFISFSIAAQGWLFYKNAASSKNIIFSGAFLAVGVFDLMHIMTFSGMPGRLLIEGDVSPWFWLAARATETALFIILVSRMGMFAKKEDLRQIVSVFTMLLIASVVGLILSFAGSLPPLVTDGEIADFGNQLNLVFTIIHAAILFYTLILYRKGLNPDIHYIAPASIYLVFSSLTLMFHLLTGWSHFVAHVFKILGYFYLFRLIFIRYGERPFKEIEEMSATYRRLLNSVAEGIYGIDKKGLVTFINEPAARMLGYREDEITGRHAHTLIHHTKADGTDYLLEECPIYQSVFNEEHTFVSNELFWRKDGTSLPVEYFTRPIYEDGKSTGIIVTFMNLTERKKLQSLESEHKKIQLEIKLAADVQQSLLLSMPHLAKEIGLGVLSVPYRKLNGDFYTIVPKQPELSFAIADVCGKGIPAAIQMTMMKFAMEQGNPPEKVLSEINQFSNSHMDDTSFISMLVGTYNRETREFSYSSAGHEPGLHFSASRGQFRELLPTGPILGLTPDASYRTTAYILEPGDLLIFFTDGLIERKGNMSDSNTIIMEAVAGIDITLPPQAIAEELFRKVNSKQAFPVEDDQTLLILKV